jgi:hypothetical protein
MRSLCIYEAALSGVFKQRAMENSDYNDTLVESLLE